MKPFNPDKVLNMPPKPVAQACYRHISNLDGEHPEVAGLGLAVALDRYCDRLGVHPKFFIETARQIFTDGEAIHPEFRAADQYMREEL